MSWRRDLDPGLLAPHASALAGLRHAPSGKQGGIIVAIGVSDNEAVGIKQVLNGGMRRSMRRSGVQAIELGGVVK